MNSTVEKRKSHQQHGYGQSEDGDTLFNDDSVLCAVNSTHDFFSFFFLCAGFYSKDPTAFSADDEVAGSQPIS